LTDSSFPGGATGVLPVYFKISFYERKKIMFMQNLFGIWDVLLSFFVGTLFSVAELIGGKTNVKIGRGGGAR
jgi:hypothetical protein